MGTSDDESEAASSFCRRLPKLDDIRYSSCHCRPRCAPSSRSSSLMHTLGRCRRRSLHTNRLAITTEFRAPLAPTRTRAMAWSTNDVISLSRRRTRRRGGPVARAMGVSLPRSRALLQFSPSFSRTALDFFGPPRGVVLTSSSSCRRKLESAKFLVPLSWRVLLILPKFSVVDEVQGAFLRRTDLQSRRADRSWKWQQLNAR